PSPCLRSPARWRSPSRPIFRRQRDWQAFSARGARLSRAAFRASSFPSDASGTWLPYSLLLEPESAPLAPQSLRRALPAGLAWLPRGFAVVLIGESAPSPASPAAAAPAAPATATAATTAPAAPAAAAARRRAPLRLGTRFVHFQIASAEVFAIQACDCLGG